MGPVQAGIGYSSTHDSFTAGAEAGACALEQHTGEPASLALAFCSGTHDGENFLAGLRSRLGPLPVVGGSAIGLITAHELGYEVPQGAVALLPSLVRSHLCLTDCLDQDEVAAGKRLGNCLSAVQNNQTVMSLLFYDSVRQPPPPAPVLNVSSLLLDGILQAHSAQLPPMVGAGLLGNNNFAPTCQFLGNRTGTQHAVAVMLEGQFHIDISIMHGCKPLGDYHRITHVEGSVLYSIDGRPAMDVIDELLGGDEWTRQLPLLLVTLGVNHGEKYGPYNEKNYVNRLILGALPEKRALTLFEADFKTGDEFQFMQRNHQLMLRSTEQNCLAALERLEEQNAQPFLALYIDCAGRSARFSGETEEEAALVQKIIGSRMPLLGFYSGVELAPLLGRCRGLDWTGVLVILSKDGA